MMAAIGWIIVLACAAVALSVAYSLLADDDETKSWDQVDFDPKDSGKL